MNEKLLIELLKIVKNSKSLVLKAFEDNGSKQLHVDFDSIIQDLIYHTKILADTITQEAKTFNNDYISEDEMIDSIKDSFDSINFELNMVIDIYLIIKNSLSLDNIDSLLAFQVCKKILYEYIVWCEKVENALFEMEGEAIFTPNIEVENEIIKFIAENTNLKNSGWQFPFLGGIGLGLLLGD